MSGRARLALLLLTIPLALGCPPPEPAAPGIDDETWAQALLEHRDEKDEDFRTSRTSPMAGTQYLKSEPASEVYLTREGKVFDLAYSPSDAASLRLFQVGGTWHWTALEEGVEGSLDVGPVASGSDLEGPATFAIGGLDLSFHPSEDRVTFIVFDPERPEKTSFEHLSYYPPGRGFAVAARLVELPEPEKIEMPTSRNLIKTFYRFARIHFELEGEAHELTALKHDLTGDGSEILFIPFKDGTTGRETYGAGRYLEIEEPDESSFVLDFNRSFNPLCNYSPAYNCTLPPRENHLEVAIRAGEKTYPH